jgi:hypothetical protein
MCQWFNSTFGHLLKSLLFVFKIVLALLAELVDASDLKFVPYNKGVGSSPIQSIKLFY